MPKQNAGNDIKKLAFPIRLFDEDQQSTFAEPPSEIHIVPTGTWDHPVYGEMEITSEHIAEFVKNFKAKIRNDLPITAGHDNGMSGGELPAIGWFKELIDRGVNGLWAYVEWTAEGQKLLKEKAYKYFSPEFYEVYEDPQSRKKYNHVLVGGALTNSPYFKELTPVVAFSEPNILNQFNDNNMTIEEIKAKAAADLSDEEKQFLKDNQDQLSDEDKAKFESVLTDAGDAGDSDDDGAAGGDDAGDDGAGDAGDDNGGSDDAGDGAGDGSDAGAGSQVQGSDKKIVMSEAEVKALQDQANKGAQAFAELEKMKLNDQVSKMVFSSTNKAGHFLPKQKEAVVNFMRTLSEKQRDQFANIINNMPKVNLFTEEGDAGSEVGDVGKEVERAVQAKIKASEGKLKYSDALKAVFKENPDLEKRYAESLE